MNVVVLGGTGLLGKYLLSLNNTLHTFGKELDITNKTKLFNTLNKLNPDIVLHLAAITNSNYVNLNKIDTIQTNIVGTCNVAMWCIQNQRRLVYTSTDYVYDGYTINSLGHKETDGVNPYNLYSTSKLGGECAVKFVPNYCIIRTSFGSDIFPYKNAYTNLKVSKDYVDVIAPMILKASLSNYIGILNIGTNSKSVYDYAYQRNKTVMPSKLPEDLNFTLNTTRYNELFSY